MNCTCMRCERTFVSPRGLQAHMSRSHAVSDSFVLDFINLDSYQQEMVLCLADCDGDMAFARKRYASTMDRASALSEIVSGPLGDGRMARFKDALTQTTKIEYRYLIAEEP